MSVLSSGPENGSYEAQCYDSDTAGGSPVGSVHQLLTVGPVSAQPVVLTPQ